MSKITKEELVDVFDRFVNEMGLWSQFKEFVEQQGYTVKELGFNEDDDE